MAKTKARRPGSHDLRQVLPCLEIPSSPLILSYRLQRSAASQPTHVEVLLDPGVGGVPVLEAVVAVRVAAGEVLLGDLAGGEVGLGGEVSGDALQDLRCAYRCVVVRAQTKTGHTE